jgi:plastocyanin
LRKGSKEMKKIALGFIGMMVLTLLLTACGSSPSSPKTKGQISQQVASGSVDIQMKNIKFVPDQLTIKIGTKVTWTNLDSVAHNVMADDGSWSSDSLNNGQTFSKVFDKTGTFPYVCSFHPGMAGTIIVEP